MSASCTSASSTRHRNLAGFRLSQDLRVQEFVVKADAYRIDASVAVINAVDPAPTRSPLRTSGRLATFIDFAAIEPEFPERGAGRGDSGDIGVSGRIVGGGDLVVAFGDHLPILDDAAYGQPWPAFIISSERSIFAA